MSYRKREFTRLNEINKESIAALEKLNKIKILRESDIDSIEEREGNVKVNFKEEIYGSMSFDYVIYALGGSTPENFLKMIGIEFEGADPILKEHYETSVQGLFLLGDLTAGTRGGSIIWAFNSSNTAMNKICKDYLNCNL